MKTRKIEIRNEKTFNGPIKVGWFSNDPAMPTGYAKVTREICSRLGRDPRFEVYVFAEGYSGAPRQMENYTVFGTGTDFHKPIPALVEHLKKLSPDVLIALEDTFTLYNQEFHMVNFGNTKFIVYTPMDGKWIPSTGHSVLKNTNKIISMADFTRDVLKDEGFDSSVIWHGVDVSKFTPVDEKKKIQIRAKIGMPQNKYIFFNFGRNSMRKFNHRLIKILARVFKEIPDSIALLNMMHFDAQDLNMEDYLRRHIMKEFGKEIASRFIFNKALGKGANISAVTDEDVIKMIQASDMVISASTGEGSGLIMPEAMACMKPIVHTDYSTPNEWLIKEKDGIGERGVVVPVRDKVISSFNVEHGHVDEDKFVDAIIKYYKNKELQKEHTKNARLFVERHANWDYLVEQWKKEIFEVI